MSVRKLKNVVSRDLFADQDEAHAPLAWRMRPRDLSEFLGQEHILGPGKLLRRAIEADRVVSLILYGPPGSGKTALARIIAERSKARFVSINAVTSGVADIRAAVAAAQEERQARGRRTILFVDEIHRFNRTQQDALLPDVERGTVSLIGASTQNPFFAIIPALSSRSQIFEFKPLEDGAVSALIQRALADRERGLGALRVTLTDDARDFLVAHANGDARRALNALELGALSTPPGPDGTILFDLRTAEESLQAKALPYDDDEHYDTVSAFIKSMRGSDPDAAIYWMAKMLASGEDPLFIARRIVICASEDVGNADPRALLLAMAAYQAVERIGMPEGQIPLAQAVTYLAAAPKSNAAYRAVSEALRDVTEGKPLAVPDHLRDAHYRGAARLGRGTGYRYVHDYPGHYVVQEYLPEKREYYRPTEQGEEKDIRQRLAGLKQLQEETDQ